MDQSVLGAIRLSAVVGLLTSCMWIAVLRLSAARLADIECLAALCLISLLSIRHLAYDFVFLAPVAALAFSLPRLPRAFVVAALDLFRLRPQSADALRYRRQMGGVDKLYRAQSACCHRRSRPPRPRGRAMASLRRMTSNVAAQIFAVAASLIDRIVLVGFLIRRLGRGSVFRLLGHTVGFDAASDGRTRHPDLFPERPAGGFRRQRQSSVSARLRHSSGHHPDDRRRALTLLLSLLTLTGATDGFLHLNQIDPRTERAVLWLLGVGNLLTHHPIDDDEHLFRDGQFRLHRRDDGRGA